MSDFLKNFRTLSVNGTWAVPLMWENNVIAKVKETYPKDVEVMLKEANGKKLSLAMIFEYFGFGTTWSNSLNFLATNYDSRKNRAYQRMLEDGFNPLEEQPVYSDVQGFLNSISSYSSIESAILMQRIQTKEHFEACDMHLLYFNGVSVISTDLRFEASKLSNLAHCGALGLICRNHDHYGYDDEDYDDNPEL